MVTLTGTFTRLDGTPASGTVRVTPSRSPIIDPQGRIVISGPQTFPLDKDGKIEVSLPATDDDGHGNNFHYTIHANLSHSAWTMRDIKLPASRPAMDLSEIYRTPVTAPEGFPALTRLPTPSVVSTRTGFTTSLDYDHMLPPEGTVYYTAPGARANIDGLTPDTPRRLNSIILDDAITGGTIVVADGEYHREETTVASTEAQSNSWQIVAAPDAHPILAGWQRWDSLTWAHHDGHIYATTRAGAVQVLDVTNRADDGAPRSYLARNSPAEIVGPGEYAIDGTTVYVWALDNTDLSDPIDRGQVRIGLNTVSAPRSAGEAVWYIEGITFHSTWAAARENSLMIMKNCTLTHSRNDGGFGTTDNGSMILDHCSTSHNIRDGFNYHGSGEFIETGCLSEYNGQGYGATSNNGSTAHETVRGIRINGSYRQGDGYVIADVNSAKTWNVGCSAGEATAESDVANTAWLASGQSATENHAEIWTDGCIAHDSKNGLMAVDGGMIYHRDTRFARVDVEMVGDIIAY